jgi:aspartyl-tRNA(Asn)/glutamyl-tRNA(Gln) amidotransferase subunit A
LVVNPIDSEVAVGGSSAGSAAAVAAGFCHFSVATDTGGSVRAPAAYCGVVGFKPTSGAVPLDAGLILSPRLDHVGLLARSAADCLVCLPVLVGTKIPANHRATLTGVTFGLDEAVVSPEMVRFVEALVGRAKTRGGRLVAVRLPRSSDIVAEYRAALDGSAPPGKRLQGLRQAYAALFDLVDVVVSTPVPVPMPTRPQYDADRAGPEFYTRRAASILLNIVGAPGIVLPVRLQRGGLGSVQLSAAPGADFYLLNVAGALE